MMLPHWVKVLLELEQEVLEEKAAERKPSSSDRPVPAGTRGLKGEQEGSDWSYRRRWIR